MRFDHNTTDILMSDNPNSPMLVLLPHPAIPLYQAHGYDLDLFLYTNTTKHSRMEQELYFPANKKRLCYHLHSIFLDSAVLKIMIIAIFEEQLVIYPFAQCGSLVVKQKIPIEKQYYLFLGKSYTLLYSCAHIPHKSTIQIMSKYKFWIFRK